MCPSRVPVAEAPSPLGQCPGGVFNEQSLVGGHGHAAFDKN